MMIKPNVPQGVYVLRNDMLEAWVIPYGARLMQVWWLQAPEGVRPLNLAFQDIEDYKQDTMYLGAVCGRYSNRINNGQFEHNAKAWQLDINHPMGHSTHGGTYGMGRVNWTVVNHSDTRIEMTLHSVDGDMGYDGNCDTTVVYELQGNSLTWSAHSSVDKPCPLNLLQHSYWNLDASADLSQHSLQVNAGYYHPIDERELPLALSPVTSTAYDFLQAKKITADLISFLDNALLLNQHSLEACAATVSVKDLEMKVYTSRPYVHVYAACNLFVSKPPLGVVHNKGAGLCLETEDMPNGPNLGAEVWYGPNKAYTHELRLVFNKQ